MQRALDAVEARLEFVFEPAEARLDRLEAFVEMLGELLERVDDVAPELGSFFAHRAKPAAHLVRERLELFVGHHGTLLPRDLSRQGYRRRVWEVARGREIFLPRWRARGSAETMGMLLDSAIDLYLDHVKVERGLARNTVEAYGRDLGKFRRWCAKAGLDEAGAVESRHVLQYLVALAGERLQVRSQARNLVALRGLYKHLRAERHVERDPTADVELPRLGRPLPEVLTPEEVDRLLAAPDVKTPRGLRDAAMLETLYATGLRVSELVALKTADVNLEQSYLSTIGKGRKQRLVPIGDVACARIREYQAGARPGFDRTRAAAAL